MKILFKKFQQVVIKANRSVWQKAVSRISRKTRTALMILMGGVICSALLIVTAPKHAPEIVAEKVWPVSTVVLAPSDMAPNLALYGRVSTPRKAHLTAALQASVSAVLVDDGQPVKEGALLIQLDDRDAKLSIKQAEAELSDADARVAQLRAQHVADKNMLALHQQMFVLAQRKTARYEHLQTERLISASVLDEARSLAQQQAIALEQQRIAVANFSHMEAKELAAKAQAEVTLAQAQLNLSRTKISAPFSGLISGLSVAPGDRVNVGSELLGLIDTQKMQVRAAIGGKYIAGLRHRLAAGLPINAMATVDQVQIKLTLSRLAAEVATGRSGIDGIFEVAKEDSSIVLGRVVSLTLELPPEAQVSAVPIEAVYDNERVYVVEGERLRGVAVEVVGERINQQGQYQVLIRSPGLASGQQLMTTQLSRAITGLKVNNLQATQTPPDGKGTLEGETPKSEVAAVAG